jgi:hypothetical protein
VKSLLFVQMTMLRSLQGQNLPGEGEDSKCLL